MDSNIYVAVFENNQTIKIGGIDHTDDKGPIVMETYVEDSSLDDTKRRIERLSKKYGKARIAKLVFVD